MYPVHLWRQKFVSLDTLNLEKLIIFVNSIIETHLTHF